MRRDIQALLIFEVDILIIYLYSVYSIEWWAKKKKKSQIQKGLDVKNLGAKTYVHR